MSKYAPTPEQRLRLRGTFPCPSLHTNTSFVANRSDEFDGDARVRKFAMARANRAGVNTNGKRFCGEACRPGVPFDPEAWLPESDLKDSIKNRCIEKNWNCEELGVKGVAVESPDTGPYQVAEGIVTEEVNDIVADKAEQGERVTKEQRAELTDEVRKVASGAQE